MGWFGKTKLKRIELLEMRLEELQKEVRKAIYTNNIHDNGLWESTAVNIAHTKLRSNFDALVKSLHLVRIVKQIVPERIEYTKEKQ